MHRPRPAFLVASLVVAALGLEPAGAQTVCRTATCAPSPGPAGCTQRARVRTPRVLMTSSGVNFVFDPAEPRIEPGECVAWAPTGVTHSSSQNTCPDDALCGNPAPAPCLWETGNVATPTPEIVCHYGVAQFPSDSSHGYYCRIHATPTTGTMRGTLRVTTGIALVVGKSGADAVLQWTGGGVAGSETFKVARSAADPAFSAGATQTLDPDGGATGRSWRDVGALNDPTVRFYLIRNRQPNE
jgi:plastocyanin